MRRATTTPQAAKPTRGTISPESGISRKLTRPGMPLRTTKLRAIAAEMTVSQGSQRSPALARNAPKPRSLFNMVTAPVSSDSEDTM